MKVLPYKSGSFPFTALTVPLFLVGYVPLSATSTSGSSPVTFSLAMGAYTLPDHVAFLLDSFLLLNTTLWLLPALGLPAPTPSSQGVTIGYLAPKSPNTAPFSKEVTADYFPHSSVLLPTSCFYKPGPGPPSAGPHQQLGLSTPWLYSRCSLWVNWPILPVQASCRVGDLTSG